MKALLKPLQLATLLTFSSLSFAYAASSTSPLMMGKTQFFTSKYIFSSVSNEKMKFTSNASYNLPEEIFANAFLDISLKNKTQSKIKWVASNTFFEMTAIFNDNLQYYMAKLKPTTAKKQQENEQSLETIKPTCKNT
jgi:hypothetical protein